MIGRINLNEKTVNHPKTLERIGYEVSLTNETDPETGEERAVSAAIACEGFVAGGTKTKPVDVSTLPKAVEFFKKVVEEKRLISYATRLQFKGGAIRFGGTLAGLLQKHQPLVEALGFDPSALIAIKPKIAKTGSGLDLFGEDE